MVFKKSENAWSISKTFKVTTTVYYFCHSGPFSQHFQHTGWPKNLAHFVSCASTSSNIDQFSTYFTVRITRKFVIIPSLIHYRSHYISNVSLHYQTTLWNVSTTIENRTSSVTTHFKSTSSSNKADTLNICCKNYRMWQLLQTTITRDNKHVISRCNFLNVLLEKSCFQLLLLRQ